MSQLETKMKEGGDAYEVLQFVMSFIARKKTHLDADAVSQLIFRGATYLAEKGSPTYASTLLAWYLDGNAGEDKTFQVNDGAFSDVQRLTALLNAVSNEAGERVLDGVYKLLLPIFHSANKESQGSLHTMHNKWVDAFEAGGNWFAAFFSALIVKDYSRAASICKSWAGVGFKSEGTSSPASGYAYYFGLWSLESASFIYSTPLRYTRQERLLYCSPLTAPTHIFLTPPDTPYLAHTPTHTPTGPLFFARCALYLFSEGRKEDAAAFVTASLPHIEAVSANATPLNVAVWHAAEMMGDIISR